MAYVPSIISFINKGMTANGQSGFDTEQGSHVWEISSESFNGRFSI